MMMKPRYLLTALLVFTPALALAQGTPIRIIVGYPAGGANDIFARLVLTRWRSAADSSARECGWTGKRPA